MGIGLGLRGSGSRPIDVMQSMSIDPNLSGAFLRKKYIPYSYSTYQRKRIDTCLRKVYHVSRCLRKAYHVSRIVTYRRITYHVSLYSVFTYRVFTYCVRTYPVFPYRVFMC